MLKIDKIQKNIDSVLSAFTNAINELDKAMDKLSAEINRTQNSITEMQAWNDVANEKIAEYQKLKTNIENILN